MPELLVVLVVISVLLVATFFVLRPNDRAAERNDAARWIDLVQMTRALDLYYHDHNSLPADMPTTDQIIGTEDGNYNLCKVLVPTYWKDLPFDPQYGIKSVADGTCNATDQQYLTAYSIRRNKAGDSVTLTAPFADVTKDLTLTKHF